MARFSSYAEAAAAVSDILAKEAAASASGLEPIEEDESDDEERAGGGDQEAAAAAADAAAADGEDDEGSGDGLDEYDRGTIAGAGDEMDDEFEREYQSLLQVGFSGFYVVFRADFFWLLIILRYILAPAP